MLDPTSSVKGSQYIKITINYNVIKTELVSP